MDHYSNTTWGYKLVNENTLNFYHVLLPKIDTRALMHVLHNDFFFMEKDASLTVLLSDKTTAAKAVEKLLLFFKQKEDDFTTTPSNIVRADNKIRTLLKCWSLAFFGCIAILLVSDEAVSKSVSKNWEYINSNTGGLYLHPFTLIFEQHSARIIHPVTMQNYDSRIRIETAACSYMQKIITRIEDAQRGFEGVAMISLVKERTGMSTGEIAQLINKKSFGVQNPAHCPFFFCI